MLFRRPRGNASARPAKTGSVSAEWVLQTAFSTYGAIPYIRGPYLHYARPALTSHVTETMSELDQDTKMVDEKQELRTVDPANIHGLTANQTLAAYHAALHEHSQTVREALRVGRKAIFWMLVLGLVSAKVRRDRLPSQLTTVDRLNEALLQSFQSIPSFQREFGSKVQNKKGNLTYSLTAYQQQMLCK